MINLEFKRADGSRVSMVYDVHPASQKQPVLIPEGATCITVWLGTR